MWTSNLWQLLIKWSVTSSSHHAHQVVANTDEGAQQILADTVTPFKLLKFSSKERKGSSFRGSCFVLLLGKKYAEKQKLV